MHEARACYLPDHQLSMRPPSIYYASPNCITDIHQCLTEYVSTVAWLLQIRSAEAAAVQRLEAAERRRAAERAARLAQAAAAKAAAEAAQRRAEASACARAFLRGVLAVEQTREGRNTAEKAQTRKGGILAVGRNMKAFAAPVLLKHPCLVVSQCSVRSKQVRR